MKRQVWLQTAMDLATSRLHPLQRIQIFLLVDQQHLKNCQDFLLKESSGPTTLAKSWLNFSAQIVTAVLSRQALPLGQMCVISFCTYDALGRCLDCGPAMYLCEEHIQVVHTGGKSLHKPQAWKVRALFCINFQISQSHDIVTPKLSFVYQCSFSYLAF